MKIFDAILESSFSALRNCAILHLHHKEISAITRLHTMTIPVLIQSSGPTSLGPLERRLYTAKSSMSFRGFLKHLYALGIWRLTRGGD